VAASTISPVDPEPSISLRCLIVVKPLNVSALAIIAVVLSGCASVPRDEGRADVGQLLADRGLLSAASTGMESSTRLAPSNPLTPDAAVQLALANSPEVRRIYADLGFSAAELYDAGRLANPVLSAARFTTNDPAAIDTKLSLGIAFDITDILLQPARKRFSATQFAATKLAVGDATLRLVADVKTAWYDLAIAEQRADLKHAIAESAAASAALAQRFFDAGNISARELAMEKSAAGAARADSLEASAAATAARTRLNLQMGLPATQDSWELDVQLDQELPEPPAMVVLLEQARTQRLDIAEAEMRSKALARRYGLERRSRLVNGIELGYERERDFDGSISKGPGISLELPLFNWGGGRVRAAKASLAVAEAELDQRVLAAGAEVKSAWVEASAAYARVSLYRDEIIPQRKEVSARVSEEMNYMLVSVFEALSAKQGEYTAYDDYLAALNDYWRSTVALARAVGGQLPEPVEEVSAEKSTDEHATHH